LAVIIAVTSYALSGEEMKARAAGCDDYRNAQTVQVAADQVSALFVALHNVCSWHKADIARVSSNVRFWG